MIAIKQYRAPINSTYGCLYSEKGVTFCNSFMQLISELLGCSHCRYTDLQWYGSVVTCCSLAKPGQSTGRATMPTSPSRLPTSLVDEVSRESPTGQSAHSTPTNDCRYRSDDLSSLHMIRTNTGVRKYSGRK